MTGPLVVPDVSPGHDTLAAALAYAAAGWYVGPVKADTKNPGSLLGKDWQRRTSRDPQVISAWFAGTDHGVFLHAGRSGAVVLDVDTPDNLPAPIRQAIEQYRPPYQSTRPDNRQRGHHIFGMPAGRQLGNSLGNLANGWGEIRGANGVIVVAPSVHSEGGEYRWRTAGAVPVLPGYLATQLPDALDASEAATDADVVAFLAQHSTPTSPRPELLDIHVRSFQKAVVAGESRHGTMPGHLSGGMKEAAAGYLDAKAAADTLESVFLEAVARPPTGKQGTARNGAVARNEWQGMLAWAIGQARAAKPEDTRQRIEERFGRSDDGPLAALRRLVADLRTWQDLPDPIHVIAALAAAATRNTPGEPCWLLLVAPPSSGKTEGVRILDNTVDARLDEVTAAGLLGWSKGKAVRQSGILPKIGNGNHGLVTFGDLSLLLATSDRGGRDQVFGMLRSVYDGHTHRDIAPPGKVADDERDRLEWSGRLTVVACVTGIIDRYAAHADQLGPRWLYIRIPERTTGSKRKAARRARRSGLEEHRKRAREAVAGLLASLPVLPELPDAVWDAIEDAALVTAWGRGAVPRNGYGRREIEGVPVIEEPMRLVQQLGVLARGILALGLPEKAAAAIARRVALDSMPEARRLVLEALTIDKVLNTSACARQAGVDRKVARMTLEDLAAIGVVDNDRPEDDGDDRNTVRWWLHGDDGDIIIDVFDAFHQSRGGWDETWVYTSTSPPKREENTETTGVQPTLRPTPEEASDQRLCDPQEDQ